MSQSTRSDDEQNSAVKGVLDGPNSAREFPLELVSLIVDAAANETLHRKSTLAALCRVSHALLGLARPRLYGKLRLDLALDEFSSSIAHFAPTFGALGATLLANPDPAAMVRELRSITEREDLDAWTTEDADRWRIEPGLGRIGKEFCGSEGEHGFMKRYLATFERPDVLLESVLAPLVRLEVLELRHWAYDDDPDALWDTLARLSVLRTLCVTSDCLYEAFSFPELPGFAALQTLRAEETRYFVVEKLEALKEQCRRRGIMLECIE
ncbi:hypothetical protein JCM10207_005647 [Rhodosporidiobolus poonsookiae]